jgi:flagellar basal-body rod protein FlgG
VAPEGEGLFEVETPQGLRYTRNGNFNLDKDQNLITQEGNFVLNDDKQKIQIDAAGGIISILPDGTISVGTGLENQNVGTIGLVKFNDMGALAKEGNGLYKVIDNNVKPEKADEIKVRQGFLDRSNVNSIEEMTNMITAIRAFEAYQKVIQTIDEADEAAVNTIGRVA